MPKRLEGTEGKRIPLNMRTTQATRDILVASAQASGRSLSQEVEHIIEQHFERQSMLDAVRQVVREERA